MKWSTLYILASVFIFSVQFYKVSYGDDKENLFNNQKLNS